VCEVVRRNRLRWFENVERKSDDDWVKKCQQWMTEGKEDMARHPRRDDEVGTETGLCPRKTGLER